MSEPGVYDPNKKVVVESKETFEKLLLEYEASFVNICFSSLFEKYLNMCIMIEGKLLSSVPYFQIIPKR